MKASKYLTLTTASLLATSASATLLVYEGFGYGATGVDQVTSAIDPNYNLLHLQPDGVGGDAAAQGLSGAWIDTAGPGTSSDLFMNAGSLSFGNLPTSGNHVRGDTNQNNDNFGRSIVPSLNGGTELWFSFLAEKVQNDFSAAEGGIVIGNQQVNNTRILLDTANTGLNGIGIAPTTNGNNWTAYGWDGSSQTVGGSTLGVGVGSGDVRLLIGELEFGGAGADTFNFYEYLLGGGGTTIAGGSLSLVTSFSVDVDEAALDTLSLTRQVNTAYDEIRIGTSLDDVLGVVIPEPSVVGLMGLGGLLLARRLRRR